MDKFCEAAILDISRQFHIYGDLLHAEPCKIGHINETYIAAYNQGGVHVRYVHQRLNTNVFKHPEAVMNNILLVTAHQRQKLMEQGVKDISRRTLTVIPARDGRPYVLRNDGECWRTFSFVERARTHEAAETPSQAYEAGKAFGQFQSLLADLPSTRLAETIPHFHNTRRRFKVLEKAVRDDHYNRAESAKTEIEFALKQEKIIDTILNLMAKGKIPSRITHNDTKFNNVMLDVETGRAMCVVDLDTVMPGCVLYDFGDMVRTTTSPTLEDELDLSKVQMHMPMFKALARGYMESAGSFLTKQERSLIAFAGKLITYTIGIRFLADYLCGDSYFRVHRPGHNLDRCRTQFRLVQSIESQEEAMQKFADSL